MEILFYMDQSLSTLRTSSRLLRSLSLSTSFSDDVADEPSDRTADQTTVDEALAAGVARFSSFDEAPSGGDDEGGKQELSRVQQLLLYVLNVAHSRGYSRFGTDCYERRLTRDGYDTRSWKRVCTVKELVYDVTRKELNFEQWLNLTHAKGNAGTVVDYLTSCVDAQFPPLTKDRHVFSFRNGVYVAHEAVLTSTESAEGVNDVARFDLSSLKDSFLPYGSHDTVLPPRMSACKYFDEDFPIQEGGASSVDRPTPSATPFFDSILEFQKFEPEVREWMCVLIGRLMYSVGELDGWQVVPYLKGQASSGKSTILMHVCRKLYDCGDVGVLSNNIERKFGISSLADKYLFVAPEIKSDLQMEQADFQSMVSGEALQLAVKHQQAYAIDWQVPGIMAGNEVPGWIDNSGSIGRRMIVFEFMRKVVDGDTELGKKLNREIGSIILRCNRAYHSALRKCGNDNVWCHLPEYFKRTKADLTESTNPLQHFMNSGKLEYHPDAYMPMDALKRAFRSHCDENNFKQMRLTKDKYEPIMIEYGVALDKSNVARSYPRTPHGHFIKNKEWCIGADIRAADDNNNGGSIFMG
jgi:hypothetical protein